MTIIADPEPGLHVEKSAVENLVDEGDSSCRSTAEAGGARGRFSSEDYQFGQPID